MIRRLINFGRAKLRRALGIADRPGGLPSFSQYGEDIIIYKLFLLRNIAKPSFLDIGAHDPFSLSNTALLYHMGCRGINVEANPALIDRFHVSRPEDINLNIGVAPEKGEMDFFVMEDASLSTASVREYELLKSHGKKLMQHSRINVVTINEIVATHFAGKFPELLTIDIEGMDLEILKSLDYTKSRPLIICVESTEYSPDGAGKKRTDLIDFLKSKGYFEIAFTGLNSIMILEKFWFQWK